jgi:endoglucanase
VRRNLGLLAGLAILVVLVGVVGLVGLQRLRGNRYIDDALRQDSAPAYVTSGPTVDSSGAVRILDAQPITGSLVQLAIDAPPETQAMQLSTSVGFEDAGWEPFENETTLEITDVGFQTIFAKFLLEDGTETGISVTGVERDPTYAQATSSENGPHTASWVRPFSATELVVRVEAGRLELGAIEPYDLTAPQSGDDVDSKNGALVVKRDGDTYGFQVSKRTDAIRRPDRLIGSALDADAVVDASWSITATDDPTYASGLAPVSISHMARPAAIGTAGNGDRISAVTHDLVIVLPEPLQPGVNYTLAAEDQLAPMSYRYDADATVSPAIRVNQYGLAPGDELKVGYLSGWFDELGRTATARMDPAFRVVNVATGTVVLRGTGQERPGGDELGKGDLTGSPVIELDFSDVTDPGRYRLCVDGIGCSYDFEVSGDVWQQLTASVARAAYHQRSGTELGPPFTPIARPRPYHPDDGVVVRNTDYSLLQAQIDTTNTDFATLAERRGDQVLDQAWGGHFDAGDWDRRINHLWFARTAAQLVMNFPDAMASSDFNIPESGDQVPDLLDEALWSVDLYRRMQTADGAIRGGIEATEHPPPHSASWVDDLAVIAYEPDPFSTYVYAGSAAEMATALRPYDSARSDELLTSALAAMAWAEAQPIETEGAAMVEGQRNVAAAALLLATGDEEWHNIFVATASFLDEPEPYMSCHSHTRCDAAWLYLQADESVTDAAIRENLTDRFIRSADATLVAANSTTYGWTTENPFLPLIWGLGSGGAPHNSGLLKAYLLTGDDRYRNAAVRSAGFSLGANPQNRVMLTGIGEEPVRSPQINDVKHGGLPLWPGTPVYGNHLLNSLEDDQWVVDDILTPAGATPEATEQPYLWQWYDVGSVALFNEFTVHQSHAEALWTFGTLAATANG